MRRRALACALAASSLSGACGTCLVVATRDSTLTTRDGAVVPIRISVRLQGFMQRLDRDQVLPAILTAPLLECVDWLALVPATVGCLLDRDLRIEGGPFGLLAALTPFANVTPGPQLSPPSPRDVDPADVELLRGPPGPQRADALRRIFPDLDVRAVTLR